MKTNLSRKTLLLINLTLGQVLVVGINGMWGLYGAERLTNISQQYILDFSTLAGFILAGASVYLVREILRLAQKETEAGLIANNLKKNEELLRVLRSQRHDFANHLQVIYGLVQLKKIEKLSSYIGELTNDIETENRLGGLACAEFTALLLRKKSSAIEQGIKFELDVYSDLEKLTVPAIELVSIAGNLIDNAFFAIKDNPHNNSMVLLTIDEDDDFYTISVANTGNQIVAELKEKIFKYGFTTKGKRGSGLGLHIVRELVIKNEGIIELVDEVGFSVCFQIKFPK